MKKIICLNCGKENSRLNNKCIYCNSNLINNEPPKETDYNKIANKIASFSITIITIAILLMAYILIKINN